MIRIYCIFDRIASSKYQQISKQILNTFQKINFWWQWHPLKILIKFILKIYFLKNS